MKFARGKLLLLTIIAVVLLNLVISKSLKNKKKNRQVHLVRDMNGVKSDLQQVVRRSPSVTTVTKMGRYGLTEPSNTIHMGNSNTSNSPNVGHLGTNPEIVGKRKKERNNPTFKSKFIFFK